MCSQSTTWDHLGPRKAPVEAGTGCWQHQLALALGTTAGSADHRDGQSVPNSEGVINMKQRSTHSWEQKKCLCCYCPVQTYWLGFWVMPWLQCFVAEESTQQRADVKLSLGSISSAWLVSLPALDQCQEILISCSSWPWRAVLGTVICRAVGGGPAQASAGCAQLCLHQQAMRQDRSREKRC